MHSTLLVKKYSSRVRAVIGGGCTGILAVIALAKSFRGVSDDFNELHLFDPSGFANGGIAYGMSGQQALLNDTADAMSPWDPNRFSGYCRDAGLNPHPKAFHPREIYGGFLKREYDVALHILKKQGVRIHEHTDRVESIETARLSGTYDVESNKARLKNLEAGDIILATGYGPNQSFRGLQVFRECGYVHTLYEPKTQQNLRKKLSEGTPRILVIGTGPGLFDFIQTLPESFNGSIVAVSKSGLHPGFRDVIFEGKEKNIALTPFFNRIATAQSLANWIKENLSLAEHSGSTRRRMALDLQKDLHCFLVHLEPTEQKKFFENHLSQLLHEATPVPPESWSALKKLQDKGCFEIRRQILEAKHIHYKCSPQKFHVALEAGTEIFDMVINCTGHDPLNNLLLSRMLKLGLAQKSEISARLQVDSTGYRLKGSGIVCVGPAVNMGLDGVETFYKQMRSAVESRTRFAAPDLIRALA